MAQGLNQNRPSIANLCRWKYIGHEFHVSIENVNSHENGKALQNALYFLFIPSFIAVYDAKSHHSIYDMERGLLAFQFMPGPAEQSYQFHNPSNSPVTYSTTCAH